MIKLYIENNTDFDLQHEGIMNDTFKAFVEEMNIKTKVEANVVIIDSEKMKEMYNDYKGQNKTTDILSFPSDWKTLEPIIGYIMLGDIFLNPYKLEEQAKEFGHSSKREWVYMLAHGLLHLYGYDHQTKDEESEMNSIAYKIMDRIKVGRDG